MCLSFNIFHFHYPNLKGILYSLNIYIAQIVSVYIHPCLMIFVLQNKDISNKIHLMERKVWVKVSCHLLKLALQVKWSWNITGKKHIWVLHFVLFSDLFFVFPRAKNDIKATSKPRQLTNWFNCHDSCQRTKAISNWQSCWESKRSHFLAEFITIWYLP